MLNFDPVAIFVNETYSWILANRHLKTDIQLNLSSVTALVISAGGGIHKDRMIPIPFGHRYG